MIGCNIIGAHHRVSIVYHIYIVASVYIYINRVTAYIGIVVGGIIYILTAVYMLHRPAMHRLSASAACRTPPPSLRLNRNTGAVDNQQ
jgi:hypothetical protein